MEIQQQTEVKYLGACMCQLISCTQYGYGVIVGFSVQGEEYYCLFDDGQAIRNASHAQVVEICIGAQRISLNPLDFRIQTRDFFVCAIKVDTNEKTEVLKKQMRMFEQSNDGQTHAYCFDYCKKIQQIPVRDVNTTIHDVTAFTTYFDNRHLSGFQNSQKKYICLNNLDFNIRLDEAHHGKKLKTFQGALSVIFKNK